LVRYASIASASSAILDRSRPSSASCATAASGRSSQTPTVSRLKILDSQADARGTPAKRAAVCRREATAGRRGIGPAREEGNSAHRPGLVFTLVSVNAGRLQAKGSAERRLNGIAVLVMKKFRAGFGGKSYDDDAACGTDGLVAHDEYFITRVTAYSAASVVSDSRDDPKKKRGTCQREKDPGPRRDAPRKDPMSATRATAAITS